MIIVVATTIGALMPAGPITRPEPEGSGPPQASPQDDTRSNKADDSQQEVTSESPRNNLIPGADGSVTLQREGDGHFYAEARVNGAPVRFLIDTGASGVALAQDDARRAGISVSDSSFEVIGQGASGEVRGQAVSLDSISLGHKQADDLPAVILEGSQQSLLGQNFLRTFETVSIEGDKMVLR